MWRVNQAKHCPEHQRADDRGKSTHTHLHTNACHRYIAPSFKTMWLQCPRSLEVARKSASSGREFFRHSRREVRTRPGRWVHIAALFLHPPHPLSSPSPRLPSPSYTESPRHPACWRQTLWSSTCGIWLRIRKVKTASHAPTTWRQDNFVRPRRTSSRDAALSGTQALGFPFHRKIIWFFCFCNGDGGRSSLWVVLSFFL